MTNNSQPSSILFVDPNVADYQTLVNSVELGTEVVILDANSNGIEDIAEILGNYSDLDSIQILSHGNSASLQLGNTSLDDSNIESYQNQLQQWGQALSSNGDIILYGCNVAKDELGQGFINGLSEITEADIAASDNLTGSSDLGGDWILEATTGFIDAPLAFQVEAMSAFNSVLQTFMVTNTNDSGAGSLRQAILDAENNNNGGTKDIIDLSMIAGQTINIFSSLPTIAEQVEIRGNGVTIDGGDPALNPIYFPLAFVQDPLTIFARQILAINAPNTQIILSDLIFRDGRAEGIRGVSGGGGGLGANLGICENSTILFFCSQILLLFDGDFNLI